MRHYSLRTEEAYVGWVKRFIKYHAGRHPREMGGPEVRAFLEHLAVEGNVSASTQNQALQGLIYLYAHVLELPMGDLGEVVREQDMAARLAGVWLPEALAVKFPNAPWDWNWQWVFPARQISVDPVSGTRRRYHVQSTSSPEPSRRPTAAALTRWSTLTTPKDVRGFRGTRSNAFRGRMEGTKDPVAMGRCDQGGLPGGTFPRSAGMERSTRGDH